MFLLDFFLICWRVWFRLFLSFSRKVFRVFLCVLGWNLMLVCILLLFIVGKNVNLMVLNRIRYNIIIKVEKLNNIMLVWLWIVECIVGCRCWFWKVINWWLKFVLNLVCFFVFCLCRLWFKCLGRIRKYFIIEVMIM